MQRVGESLDAGEFRRNIITRGVKLNEIAGKRFGIGNVAVDGTSLCEPRAYLERIVGKPILRKRV